LLAVKQRAALKGSPLFLILYFPTQIITLHRKFMLVKEYNGFTSN